MAGWLAAAAGSVSDTRARVAPCLGIYSALLCPDKSLLVSGKLDVVCFDETGTLTEDGLDVLGVRAVEQEIEVGGVGG